MSLRPAVAVVLIDLAAAINAEHAAALEHVGKAMTHALNVGDLLLQAKETCKHGQWLPWLREHVAFSERTAQGYMRLAQRREIRNGVADMSVREGLRYLARPRMSALLDDLGELSARRPDRKPVVEWTDEDAAACGKRIRAFDEIMHKYGVCPDPELSDCCLRLHATAAGAVKMANG
jgi:hypothetical protein